MTSSDNQEWTVVSYKKKKVKKKKTKPILSDNVIKSNNNSMQDWDRIVLKKKSNKSKNVKTTAYKKNYTEAHLIDDNPDTFKHKKITHQFKTELIKARNKKNITQEQLAKLMNIKKSIINKYEQGTTIPNNTIINKLRKILGYNLPKLKNK